jgi:Ca2+-binding EF-hand superfamily protein
MKIASENAALALSQVNPTSGAQKRRESAELEAKTKIAANERTVIDTVELSETKPVAQKSRVDAQIPTPIAPTTEAAATPADPLAELLKSFGQRSGDEGFNSALDTNGDGVINFADLNATIGKLNEPATTPETGGPLPVDPDPLAVSPASVIDEPAEAVIPADADTETGAVGQPASSTGDDEGPASFTAIDIDRLLGSFGVEAGAEGFNSQYDFDNDGVINFGDLNALLSRISGDAGVQQQSLLEQLTDRIGSSKGDERFNPNLDFDNDGIINFGDLNTLLTNLAQSRASND